MHDGSRSTSPSPRRSPWWLLVALPFLLCACELILGLDTPKAAVDAGVIDAEVADAEVPDAGPADAEVPDAGIPDASVPPDATVDASKPDAPPATDGGFCDPTPVCNGTDIVNGCGAVIETCPRGCCSEIDAPYCRPVGQRICGVDPRIDGRRVRGPRAGAPRSPRYPR
jgi:hypothetical protein